MTDTDHRLNRLRNDIRAIDKEVLRLLGARFSVCNSIGNHKQELGLSIKDQNQESQMLDHYHSLELPSSVDREFLASYLNLVTEKSVSIQSECMKKKTNRLTLKDERFSSRLPELTIDKSPSEIPPWTKESGRFSAVLFLFTHSQEGKPANILLTRRTTKVGTHKGEIGFVGGHRDPEDKSPIDTALRECFEEIGIRKESIKVHASLTPTQSIYGKMVVPIIATTTTKDFKVSTDEVSEVIEVPYDEFFLEKSQPFDFNAYGVWRESESFIAGQHNIWGLTARMIAMANIKEASES